MTQPGRERTGRIAATATLACHLAIAVWLLHGPDAPPRARAHDRPLQVAWIDPPPAAVPVSPPPGAPAGQPLSARADVPAAPAPRPALAAGEFAASPAPAADDTPTPALATQARAWARAQAAPVDFAPDPLRHREPPRPDGAFAMREPISAQDVVEGIGALLFGGGPTDPCPQIRRNLANADLGAGRALAEEELHRLRRDCL
ncbi:hypothetical protein [Luteimonas sp. FCS-9]|uniref:hypothetical protein n=1 Tax=Luteimonas sp. FCS-9 TaxID=1547516 RepID=UPI00063E83FA|nr:hypothetical protein [Luteimonas sp. FCS-9]KLI99410.1 hypothetical protein WQ56_12195 [Luteimonas sp. FCS-9]